MKHQNRSVLLRALFALLLVSGLLLLLGCRTEESAAPLQIYFLDVGQGDCALLRTAQGDILIDAGPESAQESLVHRLRSLGVTSLRLAIFTHPDEDHLGGADGVLEHFPAEQVWVNGSEESSETVLAFLSAVQKTGAALRAVRAGERIRFGETELTVLAPMAGTSFEGNSGSVIVRVTCGEASALFSGDAELEAEEALLERYGREMLSAGLYKVSHHGAANGSSEAFLRAVRPQYAVICCGAENPYGHPNGATLLRLAQAGAEIYRTDLCGDILFVTEGTEWERIELWQRY
ncbi:MAG: MBL fold metallo-hydrolase [Clostridia bacterium]|nr:MBL fold metallo-hydrolase [Clostridia bacterium]MBQ1963013.1 MBL fold metallo-hydrolase [Clostridia bacterium]